MEKLAPVIGADDNKKRQRRAPTHLRAAFPPVPDPPRERTWGQERKGNRPDLRGVRGQRRLSATEGCPNVNDAQRTRAVASHSSAIAVVPRWLTKALPRGCPQTNAR